MGFVGRVPPRGATANLCHQPLVSLLLSVAADPVHQRDEGKKHGNDDTSDDDGQEDNHDRLQERGHGCHRVIHFVVVVIRDFEEHFREGAGLFADVHHADDHGGEDAGSFERGGDGFTLFDTLMDFADGFADDDIAGGLFDDGQGLQDGHTAADEGAERARKAGDSDLANDRPDDGHLEFKLVKGTAAELGADEEQKHDHERGYAAHRINEVVLDYIADAEHQAGEGRQGLAFQHAGEHILELGNDIRHQDR